MRKRKKEGGKNLPRTKTKGKQSVKIEKNDHGTEGEFFEWASTIERGRKRTGEGKKQRKELLKKSLQMGSKDRVITKKEKAPRLAYPEIET